MPANNKPGPLDPEAVRQGQIERDDREAHEHFYLGRAFTADARLDGKIAALFEQLDEPATASLARREEREELRAAQQEKLEVIERLVDERILQNLQPTTDAITKLHDGRIQLGAVVSTLHQAITDTVPQHDSTRRELERLFPHLSERLGQPVDDRHAATALLEQLERYLKPFQRLAQANDQVREIWLEQADILTGIL